MINLFDKQGIKIDASVAEKITSQIRAFDPDNVGKNATVRFTSEGHLESHSGYGDVSVVPLPKNLKQQVQGSAMQMVMQLFSNTAIK